MIEVEHDAAARRFTADVAGERAVLDYTLADGVMTITHTGVPRPIEGRGVAAELMRQALKAARVGGWRVVPVCSYAVAYLEKHPEEAPADVTGTSDHESDLKASDHESDLLDEALEESFPASDPPSVGHSS
jgi:predicted GNAT family acetyltransferase